MIKIKLNIDIAIDYRNCVVPIGVRVIFNHLMTTLELPTTYLSLPFQALFLEL
jgi:hypothetical protein